LQVYQSTGQPQYDVVPGDAGRRDIINAKPEAEREAFIRKYLDAEQNYTFYDIPGRYARAC